MIQLCYICSNNFRSIDVYLKGFRKDGGGGGGERESHSVSKAASLFWNQRLLIHFLSLSVHSIVFSKGTVQLWCVRR